MKTPPLLLAAGLLFWGWQTDKLIFAIPLALALEIARVLPTRFEFSTTEFHRVWNLCMLGFLGTIVFLYVSLEGLGTIFALLQWVPLILFPIAGAQAYSTTGRTPTRAFKIFYDEKKDGGPGGGQIDILYPYFGMCIFASSAINESSQWFFWGMCFLSTWGLWSVRSKRFSYQTWASVLVVVIGLGYVSGVGLFRLQNYIDTQVVDWLTRRFQSDQDPYKMRTAIGEIGELKMNGAILYRVKLKQGQTNKIYLPQSTYNKYKDATWYTTQSKYQSLASTAGLDWNLDKGTQPDMVLNVAMGLRKGNGLLLVPNQAFQFEDLPVSFFQYNGFGMIKVQKGPEFVAYDVGLNETVSRNGPPNEHDLDIPESEAPALKQLVKELGLEGKPPREILDIVMRFFNTEFQYSLVREAGDPKLTPLADFLTQQRKGHCEYFATAAVLLLRAAGIPARYTFGYSAHETEFSLKNFVVRARDAHAWAIAYVDGRWQVHDTTPSVWVEQQNESASGLEVLSDLWEYLVYQFSLFRYGVGEEEDRTYLVWFLVPPVLFLAWRIYTRTRRAQSAEDNDGEDGPFVFNNEGTGFFRIEQKLNSIGLEREQWETYSQWLARVQHEKPDLPLESLQGALALHNRKRFDPKGVSIEEESLLMDKVNTWTTN